MTLKFNPHAQQYIYLNLANIKKTTGWHNNCGFNCLTHFILSKLESDELSPEILTSPEYQEILKLFQQYYNLSKQPTWDVIRAIINEYTTPTDREFIFGPVFRQYLEELLLKNTDILWDTIGSVSFSDYMMTGKVKDNALSVYASNSQVLDDIRYRFQNEIDKAKTLPASIDEIEIAQTQIFIKTEAYPQWDQVLPQIHFQRINDIQDKFQNEAKIYWMNEGCQHYANLMGSLMDDQQMSAEQFELIANTLKITLEVYTQASIQYALNHIETAKITHGMQNVPETNYPLNLRVYNWGGHWEFEGAGSDIGIHNEYYTNILLSRKFPMYRKLLPGFEQHVVEQIHAYTEQLLNITLYEDNFEDLVEDLSMLVLQGHISKKEQKDYVEQYLIRHANIDANNSIDSKNTVQKPRTKSKKYT